MKFILTCGGTAGHIYPAAAIAEKLEEKCPGSQFLFVGAEGQMETELVPRMGYGIKTVTITNISRGHSLEDIAHNIETFKNAAFSTGQARKIIKSFAPDAVIGTGGYVCFPVILAAHELHIPTFLHESNAYPGLTTRMLSGIADCIMTGFAESTSFYSDKTDTKYTGTPVRTEFMSLTKAEARKSIGIPDDMPFVLSVWGSLGAEYMNGVIREIVPDIREGSFMLLHSTGKRYYSDFKPLLDAGLPTINDGTVDIREFIYDIPTYMAAADLVLCRAGASTLAELAYLGKPAIIVPSPNVTGDHQLKNARFLEKAGAAQVMLEGEFSASEFLRKVETLSCDRDALEAMSNGMDSIAVKDATDIIADCILKRLSS